MGAVVGGAHQHLKQLTNNIKVVSEHWRYYFSEILDEDVQEGADECEGI